MNRTTVGPNVPKMINEETIKTEVFAPPAGLRIPNSLKLR